ncbi:MAG: glycosyltransferase family 2 protein [Xanthomonadaceae bacterium]|nr:glycosyltransferase family 2 protein [Xanthomonadaceae bacterium]MDE1964572.1 glycosyltransferase family 2 protein [Xanthomonadaceae bacterium]
MHERIFDDVTVVCVTYQSRALAEPLAERLRPFAHVILVDNGSTDGTASALQRLIPHARILQREDNGGFGKANNEGMAQVLTPMALLLNPDCSIDDDALDALVRCMDRYPTAGAVAPQGWRADRRPQKSFRPAFFERQARQGYRVPDAVCSAQWLNGCCLLLRTDAFHQIGGFDEQFFLYYEDDDLCLRLRRAGYECLLDPAANALHAGGGSSSPSSALSLFKAFHYCRSRHLAICKYEGRRAGRRYLARTLLAAVPLMLAYGLMLQRRHAMKWLGWGAAAACGLVARRPREVPGREPTRRPHVVAKRPIEPLRRAWAPRHPLPLNEDRPAER